MSATPLRYAAMQQRMERTVRAERPRERGRIRLWLPLTPLLILLSPFAVLLALLAFIPARLAGVNALAAAFRLGAVLLSISGTLVEVEAADASVRLKIV